MAKRFKDVPNVPFAPVAAVLFALVVTALMFATPAWRLERLVTLTGLADIFSPARPPLGDTARALMAVTAGGLSFIILWAVLRPLEKLIHNRRKRAVSHSVTFGKKPQAVPEAATASTRRPIFTADDLGAPLMSDAALSSGEELFLDAAMIAAPVPLETNAAFDPAPAFDDAPAFEVAPVFDDERAQAVETAVVKAPEVVETPVVEFVPAPLVSVIEWLTAHATEPQAKEQPDPVVAFPAKAHSEPRPEAVPEPPVALRAPSELHSEATPEHLPPTEPTLRELLVKFEAALKRRDAAAAQGRGPSAMMPETTAQSLRDLMASGRLR